MVRVVSLPSYAALHQYQTAGQRASGADQVKHLAAVLFVHRAWQLLRVVALRGGNGHARVTVGDHCTRSQVQEQVHKDSQWAACRLKTTHAANQANAVAGRQVGLHTIWACMYAFTSVCRYM